MVSIAKALSDYVHFNKPQQWARREIQETGALAPGVVIFGPPSRETLKRPKVLVEISVRVVVHDCVDSTFHSVDHHTRMDFFIEVTSLRRTEESQVIVPVPPTMKN